MKKIERKWARIALVILYTGIVLLILGWLVTPFSFAGFACLIGFIIVSYIKCRCPYCGSQTPTKVLTWNLGSREYYCTECGKKIEYEES